jgi:hypothetical protein
VTHANGNPEATHNLLTSAALIINASDVLGEIHHLNILDLMKKH